MLGVLAGVAPLQTLVERDGTVAAIPDSVFLERAVRQ